MSKARFLLRGRWVPVKAVWKEGTYYVPLSPSDSENAGAAQKAFRRTLGSQKIPASQTREAYIEWL
jgi:hypothetical protein